jgi:acyl-CoA synthetase (AMP-forming)/AMP-acid ligase II
MKAIGCFLVGALAVSVVAQSPSPQERAAAIKDAATKNQAALRQYSWVETTEVSLKGEVKKKEQKQCSYGADGKVQKTPVGGAAPAQPAQQGRGGGRRGGGRMKETIVENKVEDMKEYMEKVAALVHEYVPPDPAKIQAAQAAGNVAVAPSGGAGALNISSYLKPGDLLSIGFDMAAKKMLTYRVTSYVEKPKEDDVTLNVTFGQLTDGTSYPQGVVLDVAAKNIKVKIVNSGYKKGA